MRIRIRGPRIFLTVDPGWKKFGSGINIPDPQHWFSYCHLPPFFQKSKGGRAGPSHLPTVEDNSVLGRRRVRPPLRYKEATDSDLEEEDDTVMPVGKSPKARRTQQRSSRPNYCDDTGSAEEEEEEEERLVMASPKKKTKEKSAANVPTKEPAALANSEGAASRPKEERRGAGGQLRERQRTSWGTPVQESEEEESSDTNYGRRWSLIK